MSFFYEHPTEYKAHLTHEGELKPAERAWQTANNTYGFSDGLGTVEITIGLLTLLGVFSRRWGIVGATLSFLTPFVTLSFLITTPDAWVSALGDAQHGFPYLSCCWPAARAEGCHAAGRRPADHGRQRPRLP
jgi:uncharacterized membrane protein YkgB